MIIFKLARRKEERRFSTDSSSSNDSVTLARRSSRRSSATTEKVESTKPETMKNKLINQIFSPFRTSPVKNPTNHISHLSLSNLTPTPILPVSPTNPALPISPNKHKPSSPAQKLIDKNSIPTRSNENIERVAKLAKKLSPITLLDSKPESKLKAPVKADPKIVESKPDKEKTKPTSKVDSKVSHSNSDSKGKATGKIDSKVVESKADKTKSPTKKDPKAKSEIKSIPTPTRSTRSTGEVKLPQNINSSPVKTPRSQSQVNTPQRATRSTPTASNEVKETSKKVTEKTKTIDNKQSKIENKKVSVTSSPKVSKKIPNTPTQKVPLNVKSAPEKIQLAVKKTDEEKEKKVEVKKVAETLSKQNWEKETDSPPSMVTDDSDAIKAITKISDYLTNESPVKFVERVMKETEEKHQMQMKVLKLQHEYWTQRIKSISSPNDASQKLVKYISQEKEEKVISEPKYKINTNEIRTRSAEKPRRSLRH